MTMLSQRDLIRIYTKRIREGDGTLFDIFDANFSQKENVLFEFEEDGMEKGLTFGEVEKMVYSLAFAIESDFSIRDEFIAINMDNCYQWAVAFWAVLASGNKPYLLNSRHPDELTSSILKTLNIKHAIDLKGGNRFGLAGLNADEHLSDPVEKGHEFKWANEIALSTSATTLQEKICIYTGKEILAQLSNTEKILGQTKAVRKTHNGTIKLLAFLPFYHIFGLITVYFWFTYFGYEVVLLKDYSPDTILRTIRRFGVTHVFAVPLFWHAIESTIRKEVTKKGEKTQQKFEKAIALSNCLPPRLARTFARKALKEVRNSLFGDSVRFCISGGSSIRKSALTLINGLGYPLYNGYGTSEIGITSCDLSSSAKDRIKGSIGKPFPSVTYEIKDGCLLVKGDSTCHSIIVNGQEKLTEGEFPTYDLARVDECGRYYLEGRQSDLIVSPSGENVNPDNLETHFDFSALPVTAFSILGINKGVEKVTMVIQARESISPEELKRIRDYAYQVNSALPSPGNVEEFYLTFDPIQPSLAIKASRAYLSRNIDNGSIKLLTFENALNPDVVIARGSLEEVIRDIFAKNLHLEREKIGMESHFGYDLGGGSLEYYGVLMEINSRFSLNIEFDPEHPLFTVADFASAVRKELDK